MEIWRLPGSVLGGNQQENDCVRDFVDRYAPEILEQFELVLNTVSMVEAVERVEAGQANGV